MEKLLLKNRIDDIKDLFNNKLHSLQMIADIYKVSRQAIKKILNKHGVLTDKERSNVKCFCVVCNKEFKKTRANKRNQVGDNDYCTKECYYKHIEGFGFPDNSLARRQARYLIIHKILKVFELPSGVIIHHIDGDQTHNDAKNLMLFLTQGAHIRFHRFCTVLDTEIIFDGRIDSTKHRQEARDKIILLLNGFKTEA